MRAPVVAEQAAMLRVREQARAIDRVNRPPDAVCVLRCCPYSLLKRKKITVLLYYCLLLENMKDRVA